jgi:beta-galactosidase
VRVEAEGLRVGERLVPMWSGAVHYFRTAPSRWRTTLTATRELGLPIVETYVPWGRHEVAEGRFEFGEHDPQLDLPAFLRLAAELDLLVYLRPGPCVNSELLDFGLPERVIDDPANQARSPAGLPVPLVAPPRMFPVPSYASKHFLAEADVWLRHVAEVIAPFVWPAGPVVLLQVDNEAALYFRDGPYDQDYHPDAIEAWRAYLKQRYGTLGNLAKAHGNAPARWNEVRAPERFDAKQPSELPRHLDWMALHEKMTCDALVAMAQPLKPLGLPITHNLPMGDAAAPASIAAVQGSVDLVGLDAYARRGSLDLVKHRSLRLVGMTPHANMPELGVGAPPWFAPRADEDTFTASLAACAWGVRGFNLYMLADREWWYGALIDDHGAPQPAYATWRRLLRAFDSVDFHRLRLRPRVAIQVPREYRHLSRATHALGALSPVALDALGLDPGTGSRQDRFGFEEPVQCVWPELVGRLARALDAAGVPYVFVDGDQAPDAYASISALIVPSYEYADPDRWARVTQFAERGGIVRYGPNLPTLDGHMQPAQLAAPPNAVRFAAPDAAAATQLVAELVAALDLAPTFSVVPSPLQLAVHWDGDAPRALFITHSGRDDVEAELHVPHAMRLRDPIGEELFETEGSVRLIMPGQSCRMLIVEEAERVS